jgi:hypothetical protein
MYSTQTTFITHLHNMCIEVHLLSAYKHKNTFDEHTCTTCTQTSFTTHFHNMYSNNVYNLVSQHALIQLSQHTCTTCTQTSFTTHLHNMYSNNLHNLVSQHVTQTTFITHLHNMCTQVHLLTAYKHINTFGVATHV